MSLSTVNTQKPKVWLHIFKRPSLWIILALCFSVLRQLSGTPEWKSPFWFLDILLLLCLLVGLWLKERFNWQSIKLSRRQAAAVFIILSWFISMLYELTLSESPGNIGGFHHKTRQSFILAQGFYIPFVLLSYFLIRKYHFSFRDVFLIAGLVSLYEALQFGVPGTLFSPLFFLSPLVLAYYVVVYAQFLTLPLLVVDETLLWQGDKPRLPWWRKVFYGFALGITCWFIAGLWTTVMTTIFNGFERF